MNRDHIDFTKTGKCCLCGEEKTIVRSRNRKIQQIYGVQDADMPKLCQAMRREEEKRQIIHQKHRRHTGEGFIGRDDIMLGIDEQSIEECWNCLFDINRRGRRKKILKVKTVEKTAKSVDEK